jgi:peptidoglycan/xylan/chitin deacetylase (PgdA/CDA1 family)
VRVAAVRAGLDTLYFTGAHRLARRFIAGIGLILTFHRVRPPRPGAFQPNRHLEISPEFLDQTLSALGAHDIDIVSLDEAERRLRTRRTASRFAVLTFDDGYRDNLTFALPVLKRHRAPFTIYVASAFADGDGMLWWLALEASIAKSDWISATLDGRPQSYDCSTAAAKQATWNLLHRRLVDERNEGRMRAIVREIATGAGIDPARQCREECMGWDELATIAGDERATIGAHTVRHPILSRLSREEVRTEMEGGARRIAARLGRRPLHFAYPVGDAGAAATREFQIAAEVGFRTAVTTRPGVLFPEHADTLLALPRVSVNGQFQRQRYLDVLMSGAATALWNGFRRVSAA